MADFAKALESGNAGAMRTSFDDEAMMRKTVSGIKLPTDLAESFVLGAAQSASAGRGEAGRFAAMYARGGRFRFLRIRLQGNSQCALFRMMDSEGRMNYFDFVLGHDSSGKVRVEDFYSFGDGALQTVDNQLEVLCQVVKEHKNDVDAPPALVEYAEHENEIRVIGEKLYDKKFDEAIELYEKLPEPIQKLRNALILRISACHNPKTECDDLVRLFREKFPGDSGLDLYMGGYNIALSRWKEGIAGVDLLDKELGGDPFLNADRAIIELHNGDFDVAKGFLEKAAKAEPDAFAVHELQKEFADIQQRMGTEASDNSPGKAADPVDAREFAGSFVKKVIAGDAAAIRAAINTNAIYNRAIAKLDIPNDVRYQLKIGLKGSGVFDHLAFFFTEVAHQVSQGSRFRLVRLQNKNDELHALFRISHPDKSYNYADCILSQHDDGRVRIEDYRDLELGEDMSERLRRMLADWIKNYKADPNTAEPNKAAAGEPKSHFKLSDAEIEIRNEWAGRQYKEALAIYEKLPDDIKKDQMIQFARLQAAKGLQGDTYDQAVREYRKAFPDAANMDMIMIDAYRAHKLYPKVLASIDGLEKTIGGDPFMDYLRAETYMDKKDAGDAKRYAQKAVDGDPNILPAYTLLLDISLKLKRYADTSAALTKLKERFPEKMPDVKSDPAYAAYVKSPQYKAWLRKQGE